MKLNTRQTYKTLTGKTIEAQDGTASKVLTLGMVLSEVVLAPHRDKNGFRPLKSYELAQKFYDREEVELDNSDYIQIKELVEGTENYGTIIIAQTLLMLEEAKGSEEETKKK